MAVLEIFVHRGCPSEQPVLGLKDHLHEVFPDLRIHVVDDRERARMLGIVALPAFVLNGHVLAVGVPPKERLMRALLERTPHKPESSSNGNPAP